MLVRDEYVNRFLAQKIKNREGLVLVHQGERCSPDFVGLGLAGFDKFPEMYALVSVDADHADKVVNGGWLDVRSV